MILIRGVRKQPAEKVYGKSSEKVHAKAMKRAF